MYLHDFWHIPGKKYKKKQLKKDSHGTVGISEIGFGYKLLYA